MAKYSHKMMGKEVGQALVYAEPHTMTGKKVTMKPAKQQDPNTLTAREVNCSTSVMRVSTGDPARENVKTSGIKIRGTGAATKGTLASGPMG
jgi:hypothetical protein